MKKTEKTNPPNLLVELMKRKAEAQKSGGGKSDPKSTFKRKKGRNENNSNVGPSWGPRKGN